MTTFDSREEGYEASFVHDEELRFKARIRRTKLVGLWAAEAIGLEKDDAEKYAKEIVENCFIRPSDDVVVGQILRDFQDNNIDLTEHQIRRKLSKMMAQAIEQVQKQ